MAEATSDQPDILAELAWCWKKWSEGLRPEPPLRVSEWAHEFRYLPDIAAEPGRWRNARTPFLVGVMDALSVHSPCERVVFMKGAQVGATEAGNNWLGYLMHNAPGLILAVLPSLDDVKRNSATRINPLIEACDVLRERVVEPKSREPGNSIFRKRFVGGELILTGATSAKGLRSTPARYLFLDEVDGYPAEADGEGDPVALAEQRTVTFRGRRKIYMVSTPTLKGFSRIEKAYAESDQRIFEVACKHCGDFSRIVWADIRWPEGHRDQAYWACPGCGGVHEEHEKPRLLAGGRWRATAPGDGRTAGFHLSGLYSPFETWADIAVEHGRVYRDPVRLKAWVNLKLGEAWEDRSGEAIEGDGLLARREDWGQMLPAGIVCLTAGIDVQVNRIELTVLGWGAAEECWIVEHRVIWGDPSAPQIWADLDASLARAWPHAMDIPDLEIRAATIDTGGAHTLATYAWVRGKEKRRTWAIKGRSTPGAPLWPRRPTRANKGKIPLYVLNVDAGKDALYARLRTAEPGPGFIHLHASLTDVYAKGLTAERVKTVYRRGRPTREWALPEGVRNEPLDCFVYGLAALYGLKSMGLDLDREAAHLAGNFAPRAVPPEGQPVPARPTPPPAAPRAIRSKWMNR